MLEPCAPSCPIVYQAGGQQADGQAAADGWTSRGAHLLLQVRARVLNSELADNAPGAWSADVLVTLLGSATWNLGGLPSGGRALNGTAR
jgi:hypothetical protein